jgi:hypothetical protein
MDIEALGDVGANCAEHAFGFQFLAALELRILLQRSGVKFDEQYLS